MLVDNNIIQENIINIQRFECDSNNSHVIPEIIEAEIVGELRYEYALN